MNAHITTDGRLRIVATTVALALACSTLVVAAQGPAWSLPFVGVSNGAVATGGAFVLHGAVGQGVAASAQGGAFGLEGGFGGVYRQSPAQQRIFLPVVER